jgi:hypothetical protein
MATPWVEDGHVYGPCSYGQFRCLRLDTGERLWETFQPTVGKAERWGNCFVVKNRSQWFLLSEQGDLIIARLSPKGYEELSRAHVIEPDNRDPGRPVVWSSGVIRPLPTGESTFETTARSSATIWLPSNPA